MNLLRAFRLAPAWFLAPAAAFAQLTISGSATPTGDGRFTYEYLVDNTLGSSDVFSWSLEFFFEESVADFSFLDAFSGGDVTVPSFDWIASSGAASVGQSALNFDAFPFAEVPAGGVLGGFSFVSSLEPGTAHYFAFDLGGGAHSGAVIGPASRLIPIPEPSAGSILAAGFLVALVILRGRNLARRREAPARDRS